MFLVDFQASNGAVQEGPDLIPGPGQVRIAVQTAGLNRADLLQRKGLYPPPPGASPIPGLEVAGVIDLVGPEGSSDWLGREVCALLAGGGYASQCLVDVGQILPKPEAFSWAEAGAFPEAFLTADETLFQKGELQSGERVLIQAGSSGVGSAAIQLAKRAGAEVWCTTRSPEKIGYLEGLGADRVFLGEADHGQKIAELGGVNLVLDLVGASVLEANLTALRPRGRCVLVGLMGGRAAHVPLDWILAKQLVLRGSIMRSQPSEEKAAICQRFMQRWQEPFAQGELKPHVHATYPLADWQNAHQAMAEGQHSGKIVLQL
ncbi:MAG: NAD(P)H-quinone oxidoreductase [Acidobacteria bacterium]|nr:NAD(P)H-quinone oxidoreductase [Acidobacteriota bacterium]